MAGRMEILPLSSVVTSVRTIDRPSPVAVSRSKPGSRPWPSSMTCDVQALLVVVELDDDLAAAAALREAVVDGVLHQLGQHDRQRRGDARRDAPAVAGEREVHRPVR